ncbi:MAG: AAA family ATPase [Candidatus Bilamarchaeaceae archaeon]
MKVVITGVPGTGKTKIAMLLAAMLGVRYISLAELIDKKMATEIEEGEKAVDIKKLQRVVEDYFIGKDDYVVEGHLACEVVIPADYVFVLRTHPDVLKKRLSERKYDKKKIEKNIEAELLDYCVQRVEQEYLWRPVEIDTSKKDFNDIAKRMVNIIKYRKRVGDVINYSSELKKRLRLR